jgi:hypothetical protein
VDHLQDICEVFRLDSRKRSDVIHGKEPFSVNGNPEPLQGWRLGSRWAHPSGVTINIAQRTVGRSKAIGLIVPRLRAVEARNHWLGRNWLHL